MNATAERSIDRRPAAFRLLIALWRLEPRWYSRPAAGTTATAAAEDDGDDTPAPIAKAEGEAGGEVTISNWALYIDKDTIPEYEEESGISVDYIEDINSYYEYFGKMRPQLEQGESGGRSLMVAGDWLAKKMYDLGYIAADRQGGDRAGVREPEPGGQGAEHGSELGATRSRGRAG